MRKFLITYIQIVLVWTISAQDYEVFNDCPMEGNAKGERDKNTNKLKNRFGLPKTTDIDKTISLERMLVEGNDEARFSESKAATITGYVVHVSKKGSSETCNCHETDPLFTDTHIEVVLDEQHASKNQRVVVEVTPRIRSLMADQGIDWTGEALQELEGKQVSFTGWLLWDWRHEKDAENTDPGDPKNWRATSWEIHPVTGIEIIDDPSMEASYGDSETSPLASSASNNGNDEGGQGGLNLARFGNPPSTNPGELLEIILLSAILGMCGQVIRVMAGLKKVQTNAISDNDKKIKTILADNTSSIVLSLFIAIIVGGVAGILVALSVSTFVLDKSTVIALIAAGYAGTDLIEGFVIKR